MNKRLLNLGSMKKLFLGSMLFTSLFSGCDMIEYHPYDLDIDGDTALNEHNISLIEKATKGKKEITFMVISDTQRWYDETEKAVDFINQLEGIDFVLHTGDISDFGLKLEFVKQRDILQRLNVPFVTIIGNHDCLGTGPDVFHTIFGENNFSFDAGDVHFVCMNTNGLEFDRTEEVPNFTFMGEDLKKLNPQVKKTVAAMHAGPHSDQFNGGVVTVFHEVMKQFPNFQFAVYGHGHHTNVDDFFNDGIIYYECACAKEREILRFTINEEGYKYETLNF